MIRPAATGRSAIAIAGENQFPSSDLTNATYWLTNEITVTGNVGVAPDGTNTAVRLTDNTTPAAGHFLSWNGTGGALVAPIQCFSVYYNPSQSTRKKPGIRAVSNGWATFDFTTTPTITQVFLVGLPPAFDWWLSVGIQDVGGGWYRLWTSHRQGMAGQGSAVGNVAGTLRRIYMDPPSYTGDGAGTMVIWGAQINSGILPTPYRANVSGAAVGTPMKQPVSLPGVVMSYPSLAKPTSRIVSPYDVPETAAWFAADANVTNVSGVASAWADTLNVYAAPQATGGKRPAITNSIAGKQNLTFTKASLQELVNTTQNIVPSGNARYVLIAGRSFTSAVGSPFQFRLDTTGGRTWQLLLGIVAGQFYYFTDAVSNNVTDTDVLVAGVTAAPDITQPFICEWELTAGATPVIRFNSIQRKVSGTVNATPDTGTTGFRIGYSPTANQYWDGPVSDIYIANGIPSAANCAGLREFFMQRIAPRIASPASIPQLAMWLRADRNVPNASAVASLTDLTPASSYTLSASGGNQPALTTDANGKTVVRFTAASGHRLTRSNTDLLGSGAYTIIMCFRIRSATTDQAAFGNRAASAGGFAIGTIGGGTSRNVNHSGIATHVDGVMQTTAPEIWTVVRAAGQAPTLAINGVPVTLSNTGTTGMTAAGASAELSLGALYQNPYANSCDLDFYELCVYTTDLAGAALRQLEQMMAYEYLVSM